MPTYKVTDPTTGKTVSLTGDSPPSAQELEQVFKEVGAPPDASKTGGDGSYWSDVRKNAVTGAQQMVRQAPELLKKAQSLTVLPSGGIPSIDDIRTAGETIKGLPKTIISGLVDTANTVMSPTASFRTRPIETAATFGSLLLPAAKGAASMVGLAEAPAESSALAGIGKRVYAKAAKVAFATPEEAVLARMENPGAVQTAFSHPELADQMVRSVKNLSDTIKSLSDEASKTLSTSPYIEDGAMPKTKIADAIKSARRDLGGVFSNDSQAASGALARVAGYYKKLKSTVSEAQVKDLIQQIDGDIDWKNVAANKTNKALAGVRMRLDAMLKKQNPSYADAMVPVDEAVRVVGKVQDTFGIQHEPSRGFFATDQTVNKLKRSLSEDKLGTQRTLQRFEKISGEDWQSKIRNANARDAFERAGKGMGSTRANVGAVVGEVAGNTLGLPPAVGAALGAIGGALSDVYGPKVAARLTDALASPSMSRYVSILENAASKGARNVAATHALLMETDKKYSSAMGGRGSEKLPAPRR